MMPFRRGPKRRKPPPWVSATTATIAWEPRMYTITTLASDLAGSSNSATLLATGPHYGVTSTLWQDYGVDALRIGSSSTDVTILGSQWRKYLWNGHKMAASFEAVQASTAVTEAWCRYGIKLGNSVSTDTQLEGVKLPGFSCFEDGGTVDIWSCRMWHSTMGLGQVQLRGYFFGETWNPSEGETTWLFDSDPKMSLNQAYWIRQHLKLNTMSGPSTAVADGVLEIKFGDQTIYSATNLVIRETSHVTSSWNGEINHMWLNIFHGGSTPPSIATDYELAGIQVSLDGWPSIPETTVSLDFDLNSNSWATNPDWTTSGTAQRTMFFAHGVLDPFTGEDLEFCREQDGTPPGDNTGVRYQRFNSSGLAGGGYYWANDDTNIQETDNFPALFLPWNKWCWHPSFKIISLDGTPSAVYRNQVDGDFWSTNHEIVSTASATMAWKSNYNAAHISNPQSTDTFEIYFGGGYQSSFRGAGVAPTMKLVKAGSSKPLQVKVWTYSGTTAPITARHAVRVGNYAYWGGARQENAAGSMVDTLTNKFYRINLTTLEDSYGTGTIPQESITDAPCSNSYMAYFSLLCADTQRRILIYINGEGVFRYLIDLDHWQGPFTFGQGSNWGNYISSGAGNGSSGDWHGFVGVHRSDLNKTFFRYAISKRWHMITWNNEFD